MGFTNSIIQKQAINEILKCNDLTEHYGLILTHSQAIELFETRSYALNANGRIEFGGGIIDKFIKIFCDSPYLYMQNYAGTLHELIEIFYFYKNETLDLISDDDLIKFMKSCFDGSCQGSLELLAARELSKMARNLRYGYAFDYNEDKLDVAKEEE